MTQIPVPAKTPMTRASWAAQKTLKDVQTWQVWTANSLDNFVNEVALLLKNDKMPPEDRANLVNVQTQLTEFRKAMKPLDKGLAQATNQRFRRSRKTP